MYSPKIIQTKCTDVKISSKQRESAKEWLELLKNGTLKEEVANYPNFMHILLRDLLEYPEKEISYEAKNVEFSFKNKNKETAVCFEAKGTKTEDLFAYQSYGKKEQENPVIQTLSNMARFPARFGVATNYRKFILLDLHLGNSKCHKFDFYDIENNDDKLKEFIKIFSYHSLVESTDLDDLYDASITEEKEFTNEFYKLFHETRLMLIKEFQENTLVSRTEAINITQLFLNRLIFIFFVQDRGFISDERLFTNRILKLLDSDQSTEHSKKVYAEITELFVAFDKGDKGLGVFGFNGGLFSGVFSDKISFSDRKDPNFFSDERRHSKLLKSTTLNEKDSKIIDKQKQLNPIIYNLLLMDSFDFAPQTTSRKNEATQEVSINILGHIFEQSISDLEELKQVGVSRRKKEGVYYTPQYITDYICRNTIIPYLSKSDVSTVHELINEYVDDIEKLEKKFSEIKILDPACGSGAFLVKAIDILLEIHKEIQIVKESTGKYSTRGQFQLTKWNEEEEIKNIIENNIYGVDINKESIGITQLSLFLKLASNHRKLSGLSKNIKVGNSLISDKDIDVNAFDWNKEFPEILNPLIADKGFDIVIGNPPYVRQERLTSLKPYFEKNYQSYAGTADLYVYFLEKGLTNLKDDGYFGVIVSNKWSKATYGENLRKFLIKFKMLRFIDFGDLPVFPDATTYPCILLMKKSSPMTNDILISKIDSLEFSNLDNKIIESSFKLNQTYLSDGIWDFDNTTMKKIYIKIKNKGIPLVKYCKEKINFGLKTGLDEAFVIGEKKKNELEKISSTSKQIIKPFLIGKQIKRYTYDWEDKYIILVKKGTDIEKYPAILNHLKQFKDNLSKRTDIQGKGKWFELRTCAYYDEFLKPKIIYAHFGKRPQFTFDTNNFYLNPKSYILPISDKYLLGILNSSVIAFYSRSICPYVRGEFYEYGKQYVNQFPIPETSESIKKKITKLVDSLLELHSQFLEKKNRILNRIKNELNLENISTRLIKFHMLNSNEFLTEIKKIKSDISLIKLDEWESYFNKYKNEIILIQSSMEKIDKEIDDIVFKMYGLDSSEISLIETIISEKN